MLDEIVVIQVLAENRPYRLIHEIVFMYILMHTIYVGDVKMEESIFLSQNILESLNPFLKYAN